MNTLSRSRRGPWQGAEEAGEIFLGAAVDRADGYIHFSTAAQAAETAAKWFAGRDDLVLAAIDADALGADLRWEPSRGGALFPHLYAPLSFSAVRWTRALPLDAEGGVICLGNLDFMMRALGALAPAPFLPKTGAGDPHRAAIARKLAVDRPPRRAAIRA